MSRKILLVDDDRSTLKVLRSLLEDEGFVVDDCDGARQALERLRGDDYDVLLTDLVMPEMTGRELVDVALTEKPAIRCVVMSGHRPSADVNPIVRWLEKPLDVDVLLDAIAA